MIIFNCSQCDGEGKTPSKKLIKWYDCPPKYQKEFEKSYPIKICSSCKGSGQKEYKNKEDYFNCLVDRGQSETMFSSSHQYIFSNPCYVTIKDMGEEIIPFVIRRLQKEESWIFLILYDIVKKEDRPNTDGMAGYLVKLRDVWLEWGKEKEYIE